MTYTTVVNGRKVTTLSPMTAEEILWQERIVQECPEFTEADEIEWQIRMREKIDEYVPA